MHVKNTSAGLCAKNAGGGGVLMHKGGVFAGHFGITLRGHTTSNGIQQIPVMQKSSPYQQIPVMQKSSPYQQIPLLH